ncbi:hypothetical protein ACHAXT_002887 [Thalassiosira profunda]
MALAYEEALATLEAMFGDQGYTTVHLDAVLRHHGGHMEHTVETLLGHGDGTPDELIRKLPNIPVGGVPAPAANAGHDIDADEELARQLAAEDERTAVRRTQQQQQRGLGLASAMGAHRGSPPGQRRPMASNAAPPRRPPARPAVPQPPAGTKGRGAPTTLPADFLRIPGRKYPASSSAGVSDPIASAAGPGGMSQMMTDEQLARMLQDELFQEELRNNPEFSHLAGRRNPRAGSARAGGQSAGRSTYSGAGAASGPDFFDGLKELGDNAKRRFQEFAASWNDPNANRQSNSLFGGGGAPSGASRGNERRGLLSSDLDLDEGEEEMDFIGSGGSGRDFEMNDVGGSGNKKKD